MTKYEIMFIVQPNLEEEALKKVVKSLEKTLTSNNAVITLSKELGQKEFAYEIKKYKSGYYFLYNIEAKNDKAVKEFENGTITFSNLSDSKLDGNKVLYNGVLKAKTKKTYRLRVWVSDSYDADLENLGISFKVDVKGTV